MANKKDALGDRMKGYENITRNYLTHRVPAIIRLDGKAFHTFTRGMVKPFDPIMTRAMQQTMKSLCENVQGCVLGYTQSDEITLVLTDYATIKTDAWFGYNIQKVVSIAASMATLAFDREFIIAHGEWFHKSFDNGASDQPGFLQLDDLYTSKQHRAMFDARVFSIPKEEVCNCPIWRQQDATRMLKQRIEAKKKEIGQTRRFSPLTSCSIELDGVRYNLHSADRSSLILLLCKLHNLDTAAEKLGYSEQCMISGFPSSSWISDIQDKLEIMAQKGELEKLKAMEAQLDKLLSDDKKTELEIGNIAAALGL